MTITRTAWVGENTILTEVTMYNGITTYFEIDFGATNGISGVTPKLDFTKAEFDALENIEDTIETVKGNLKANIKTFLDLL